MRLNPKCKCDKNSLFPFILSLLFLLQPYICIHLRKRIGGFFADDNNNHNNNIIRAMRFLVPENKIIFKDSFYDSHPRRAAL